MSRAEMSATLARADRDELISVINHLLHVNSQLQVEVVRSPEIGTVQLQVREPVCEERFIIADGLATVAEVLIDGTMGWAMRLGSDPEAATAAAIADSLVAMNSEVTELWRLYEFASAAEVLDKSVKNEHLRRLLGTAINFEELD